MASLMTFFTTPNSMGKSGHKERNASAANYIALFLGSLR